MSELNDMKEIEKLYAKSKQYKISIGEKGDTINIIIKPLGLDDMDLMDQKEDATISETKNNVIKIISISLGIEIESAKLISINHLTGIMDAFKDANNLQETDMKKSGIKDYLAQKRKQIEEQKEQAVDKEALKDGSDRKPQE